MVDVPVCPDAGVTVTVRFAPLPPKTMFASGTNVVFDELRVRFRLAGAVSTSPIVKLSAPVVPFTAIV